MKSLLGGVVLLCTSACVVWAAETTNVATDPAKADADYAYQGEFAGETPGSEGKVKFGVQVIALGGGKFRAVGYKGGLPGDGWEQEDKIEVEGELKDGVVKFSTTNGSGSIKSGGPLVLADVNDQVIGELKRVERKSPTLGAKPPEGAVVLFDGKSADAFEGGKLDGDLLQQGVTSKQKFGSYMIHLEFKTPYQPAARGQGRGNSGCYLQGRYEVQILDSFGLAGKDNECGGIYSIKDPDQNMCYPPLAWQTYDIDYTAAKFDADGKKTANARMTVKHNGVVIHDDVELPKTTTAAPVAEGPTPGPVYLQDHGNPVRYRNIWVVEKK